MADIMTPALGESVTEATVAKWSRKNGDPVKKDELLVELETDKVSLEVVAPEDGVLQIAADEGSTVTPGQKLGSVGGAGAGTAAKPAEPAAAAAPAGEAQPEPQPGKAPPKESAPVPDLSAPAPQPTAAMPLAPSVQRIVTENKLDPAAIPGSGKDGRITKGDALSSLDKPALDKPAAEKPAEKPAAPR